MDVEAATRTFVQALARRDRDGLAALVAEGASFDMQGMPGRFGKAKAIAMATRGREALDLRVEAVQVKRNVAFAELRLVRGKGASGVLVLSWDQDHKVAHGTLHAHAWEWLAALAAQA